jgi:hypothetical protein
VQRTRGEEFDALAAQRHAVGADGMGIGKNVPPIAHFRVPVQTWFSGF